MTLREVIEKRRAYRSLIPAEIDETLIRELADCASLAPSCFNKQPWRFCFALGERLEQLKAALAGGNRWATFASMIIGVHANIDDDCRAGDRDYFQFDTGMANAFLLLRATELGLVAHPIAGFDPELAPAILEIPAQSQLINLVIVGKKADFIRPELSEGQVKNEENRPERLDFEEFAKILREPI
mgnify:FL=1